MLGTGNLRFAVADVMQATLGVTPGAVSMLALVNTATLVLDHESIARFLSAVGHEPRVFPVPVT